MCKRMSAIHTLLRDRRLELLTTPEEREIIDRAVAASDTRLTDFVAGSAVVAAQRVLADRDRFELDAAAAGAWEEMDSRPARELPGLRRLMERNARQRTTSWRPFTASDLSLPGSTPVRVAGRDEGLTVGHFSGWTLPGNSGIPFLLGMTVFWRVEVPDERFHKVVEVQMSPVNPNTPTCTECSGTGSVLREKRGGGNEWVPCPACGGTGRIYR